MNLNKKNYLWIGLTGGIASGKSSVSHELQRWPRVAVIDADQIAKDLTEVGTVSYQKIINSFGDEILLKDQSLNRTLLAKIVFSDKKKLEILESILHPQVQAEVAQLKQGFINQGYEYIFYDVPLLFEKKLEDQFDLVVSVLANPRLQIQRMIMFRGYTKSQSEERLQNQLDNEFKQKKSNFVIFNEGSKSELSIKVNDLMKFLDKRLQT
jgi:dephospho-CoA kinase